MEPKSVSYRVGDGSWQQLTWDPKELAYVSDDRKIKVAKPKSDDVKEPVRAQWEGSEYKTEPCTPAADATLCTIPEKNVQIRFSRFASTPPPVAGGKREPPAPPSPAPAGATGGPSTPSPIGKRLTPIEQQKKLLDWARHENRIPVDVAINLTEKIFKKVHSDYGKKPIHERDLRVAYYDDFIIRKQKELAAAGPKPHVDLGTPKHIDLGDPERVPNKPKPAAKDKPPTKKKFEADLKTALKEEFPDRLGYGGKFRESVRQKIRQALRKYHKPSDKLEQLPALIQKIKDALHKKHAIGEKIEPLPMGVKYPVTPGKGNVLDQLLAETFPDAAERAKAKTAILADLKAKFGKRPYGAKDVGAAIMRYRITRPEEHTEALPPPKPAKSKQELAAEAKALAAEKKTIDSYRKTLDAARRAFDRLDVIGKMTPEDQNKIRANELTQLHGAIAAFARAYDALKALDKPSDAITALITQFDAQMPRTVPALKFMGELVEKIAADHLKDLQGYADEVKKAFAALNSHDFERNKANFTTRYVKAKVFLNGVATIASQDKRLQQIDELKAAVAQMKNPASIRGDEKELRTKLNALEAALKRSPDPLYPHTRNLLAIEAKLEIVRAGLTPDVAKEFDVKIAALHEVIKTQQEAILEIIAEHQLRMVKGFAHKIDYGWLTDEKNRPETKKNAEQAIRALAGLFGPTSTIKASDLPWDGKLLLARGSTMAGLKERWENAKIVLQMIEEHERTGKVPELDGAKPPTADEKARVQAESAADAAYRPIEAKHKLVVASVEKIYERLFDKSRRYVARTEGPPYVDELPKLAAELERLEKELNALTLDTKVYDGLGKERQGDADKLKDKVVEAYQRIRTALNRISSIKTDDARFMRSAQLLIEVDANGKRINGATLPQLHSIRNRLIAIQDAVVDRFTDSDKPAVELLFKLKKIIGAVDARISALGGTLPPKSEPAARPKPEPAVTTAPAVDAIDSDMKASANDLLEDLKDRRMYIAGVGDDKSKLADVKIHRIRVAQILAAAMKRKGEKGMSDVESHARQFLKRIDAKIAELSGTAPPVAEPSIPPAETKPLEPPAVKPVADSDSAKAAREAEQKEIQDAKQGLATAEASFSKFNKNLKTQSLQDLAKSYQDALDAMVGFAPSADELKGKSKEYVDIAARSKAFNKKVGDLARAVHAEIQDRLNKQTASLGAIKARAEAAVKAVDATALDAAKAEMLKETAAASRDFEALSKTDWEKDDIAARSKVIDKMAREVKGLVVGKAALDSKDYAAAQTKLDEQRREFDDINGKLKENSSESQLSDFEGRIAKAIAIVKKLVENTAIKPQAEGLLARLEGIQRKIVQIRDAQGASAEIDKVRKNITALLVEAETLKDPSKKFEDLKTNQARLVEIKKTLEHILKTGLPKKGDAASLERLLNNGIITVNGYIADLENAIFHKKPVADGAKVESKKAVDPVESAREKVTALKAEASKLKGAKDLAAQRKNLARLTEIKTALDAIRKDEVPKLKGDDILMRYLVEELGYALADLDRLIRDVTSDMEQNSPKGRLEQLKNRIMSDRLRSRVTTSDDGNELVFTGAGADDLKTHAEAIGNHIDNIYGRLPKTMIIVVKDPDATGAAAAVKKSFSDRIGGLYCVIVKDPRKTDTNVDVTMFFDGKPLDARVRALQRDIKNAVAGQKAADAAAEAARVKPLNDLKAIARSRGGVAIEPEKDQAPLGKQVYAARIRVKNAAEAIAFIRLVAQALGKSEADDFLVFAHPDIAAGLADGPSALSVRARADKPGSRVFSLSPSKPGEIYIVIPAKGKGLGMGRTFADHFDTLLPILKQLGVSGSPQISDPKVAATPKARVPAPSASAAKPVHEGIGELPTPPAPAAADQPIKLPEVHKTPQVAAPTLKSRFGLKNTQAAIYRGEVDEASLNKPAKLQQRIVNIMAHAKSLGMDHVLIMYRGISRRTVGAHYAAFEAIVRNVDPEFKYLRLRNINGSSPGDGEGDIVHYVLIRDTAVTDDSIVRIHEAALREDMNAP